MPGTTGIIVEILNTAASATSWTDVTASTGRVEIRNIGTQGPRDTSAASHTAQVTLKNAAGTYAPASNHQSSIEAGNRIRVRAKGSLGKCMKVLHTGTNSTSDVRYNITVNVPDGSVMTITWQARAQWDNKWNTDTVQLLGNFGSCTQVAYTYTNRWITYTYTQTTPVTGTGGNTIIAPSFAPDLTRTNPYQYIEYRNITVTCPTISSGANLLANGTFATGTTGWSISNSGGGALTISAEDDTYIVFNGFIEGSARKILQSSDQEAVLNCTDFVARYLAQRIDLPIQRNKRADELISTVIANMQDNPRASWTNAIRADGPRRWYRLGDSTYTSAADNGTDGLAGTFQNYPTLATASGFTNGDPDTAMTFNDASSQAIILSPIDLASRSWSIEAWVNPDATGGAGMTIFGLWESGANYKSIQLWCSTITTLVLGLPYSSPAVTAAAALTAGAWNHVVATFDYATLTVVLYVAGTAVQTSTIAQAYTGTATTAAIGSNANGSYYYKGSLDEVIIYDYALTAAQVSTHYNAVFFDEGLQKTWLPGSLIGTGNQTFSVAFDTYTRGPTSPLNAMDDATMSEYGMMWVQRDGTLTFKNYSYWFEWFRRLSATVPTDTSQLLTLSSSMTYDLTSVYDGSILINHAVLTYTPRNVASGVTVVLGQIGGVVSVPPIVSGTYGSANAVAGEQIITLKYRDSAGTAIGGINIITPLAATTDYVFNEASDGTGTDYTTGTLGAYSQILLQSVSAGEATIRARNYALGPLYLTKLQVRGNAIYSYDPIRVERQEATSRRRYGERAYTRLMPFTNSAPFVNILADYYLLRYAYPFDEDQQLMFMNTITTGGVDLLSFEVGDIVRTRSNLYHMITGIQYFFEAGEQVSIVFTLSRFDPYASGSYWACYDTDFTTYDSTTLYSI